MPSIRFDMRVSRESEADKNSGRVGADPAAIIKQSGRNRTRAGGGQIVSV